MIAALVVAALTTATPVVPEGQARYRVEVSGVPVGVAELSVSCERGGDGRCQLGWASRLRLPADGGLRTRRITAWIERSGAALGGIEVEVDGLRRDLSGAGGKVPLSAAELLLSAPGSGCIEVIDEESGRAGSACATREHGALRLEIMGELERMHPGRDGFPELVELPAQQARFVRDAGAEVPAAVALELRVRGPRPGQVPHEFCGLAPDAKSPVADLAPLPRPRPNGRPCTTQARDYARRLREQGLPTRLALGVADDGDGFVWHAWVEVRTEGGWVAVDPAFGQLPARAPRFTVARLGEADEGAEEAGRRILRCWGRAAVE